MKKAILILFLLAAKISSAQIVNNGFEVWDTLFTGIYSTELANQFGVANPLSGNANGWTSDYTFGITSTTNSFAGNYAMIIHNWYSYVYQSIFYNDTIGYSPQFLQGYFKYLRGGSMWISYGEATVNLTHFNGVTNDTVASGNFTFDTASNFTPFQIPINYNSLIIPDSIHISFLNGNTQCGSGNVCNLLYLDNINLSNSPLGIENIKSNDIVVVYPNPTTNEIKVLNNSSKVFRFEIYNSLGEKLFDKNINEKTNLVSLSAYANGIYFYKINYENNETIEGKIIKQ